MNAKLFYTLNLFACMGIGACNGTNMNGMDNVPRDSGIGDESSTLSRAGVSSADQKTIRLETIKELNDMVKKELGYEFPKGYKDFLLEYDTVRLKNLGLCDPFCIFSFNTPKNKESVKDVACREMRRYENMARSFPRSQDARAKINKPFCIAVHSESHNYKDGDEDEAMIYYYIDLNSTEHEGRPLKVYSVLRDNKIESIRVDNMTEFVEYCQRVTKGIKKSIEDMERKKGTKKST